jgi:hypothetical protein
LLPPSTSISLAFALFPNINTTAPLSFRSTLLSFPFYHHLVVNSHPSIHPSIHPSLHSSHRVLKVFFLRLLEN